MYRELLKRLIAAERLRRLRADEWNRISEEECQKLCMAALENAPGTFAPATREQKNLLRSNRAQGLLPEISDADIAEATRHDAEILLAIARENRWQSGENNLKMLTREFNDITPATSRQIRQIRALIRQGNLRPLSGETLLKITRLSARRLIWRGEMTRRDGEKCN